MRVKNHKRNELILSLWNEPRTSGAIAKELGVTVSIVSSVIRGYRKRGAYVREGRMPTQAELNEGSSF